MEAEQIFSLTNFDSLCFSLRLIYWKTKLFCPAEKILSDQVCHQIISCYFEAQIKIENNLWAKNMI